jgi:hypothetical protein
MSEWWAKTLISYYKQVQSKQSFTLALMGRIFDDSVKPKKPAYLEETVLASHISRSKQDVSFEDFLSHTKYFFMRIKEIHSDLDLLTLKKVFPRMPPTGRAEFYNALAQDLEVYDGDIVTYLQCIKNVIGFGDDCIDKEGTYYIFGDLLKEVSHFEKSIAEYILFCKSGFKSTVNKHINNYLTVLFESFKKSEEGDLIGFRKLIEKSSSQGQAAVYILNYFSKKPEPRIKTFSHICAQYEVVDHLCGELIDTFIDETNNCITESGWSISKTTKLIYSLYDNLIEKCPNSEIKTWFKSEREHAQSILDNPAEFERYVFVRARNKRNGPLL